MSKADALDRVEAAYAQNFAKIEFTIHKMMLDGEFVTMLWEVQAKTLQGEGFVYSSIEVFRVVDGKIVEFWNPIHIQETNGVWG